MVRALGMTHPWWCWHLAQVVLARFLHWKALLFPFSHTAVPASMWRSPFRNREVGCTSLRVDYLHKLPEILCIEDFSTLPPFISLYSHLLVSVCTYRYLLYTLSYDPTLLYFLRTLTITALDACVPLMRWLGFGWCLLSIFFFPSFFETTKSSALILYYSLLQS